MTGRAVTGHAAGGRDDPFLGYASDVLDVVEVIPPGRVMSYGDVAEYLGRGGPRQVGRVMAVCGGAVAWWRVIHADGSPPAGHERAALARYLAEGTPLRSADDTRVRVDMLRARWYGAVSRWPPLPRSRAHAARSSREMSVGPGEIGY